MAVIQHVRLPFELREQPGVVEVIYGVNDEPIAWGHEILNVPNAVDRASGCPVVQAIVEHPAQGYAAYFGWIQILDWGVPGQLQTIVDRPPQLCDSGMPWASWGTVPTFFDSPSTPEANFAFRATAFLAYTPDAAISRCAVPLCGFGWGFDVENGERRISPLDTDGLRHWSSARAVLERDCPRWCFPDPGVVSRD